MEPILTVESPYPDIQLLKVYMASDQGDDLIYPIQLGHDIFMMRWNYEDKWRCNGIYNNEVIGTIGKLIEEQEPTMFI